MSLYKTFLLFMVYLLLAGCTSLPPTRESASPAENLQAQKFISYPNHANVYFVRPDGVGISLVDIYANDVQIGQFYDYPQFINLKATPGLHHFVVNQIYPDYPQHNRKLAEFDLDLPAGAVALIACSHFVRSRDQYLWPLQQCAAGSGRHTTTQGGITSCSIKSVSKCLLITDQKEFSFYGYTMLKADVAMIENKEASDFTAVKTKDTLSDYQGYLKKYPNGLYQSQIQSRITALQQQLSTQQAALAIKAIAAKEKCKIKDKDWLYVDKNCRGGYANGVGRAVHINQQNSFKGKISNGKLISGYYLLNGKVIYEGKLVMGKPDGHGICMHEGTPEECRYHKGFRIDALFKQRQENVKVEQQRQQDMTALRKEISSIKSQRSYGSRSSNNGVMDSVGKVVMDKAADQAVKKLFDYLF